MTRSVALLTLDAGSVLYNPSQMPDEVVTKHTDGELVKIAKSTEGAWESQRRRELEVNFWTDGRHSSPVTATATLADRQAFGFRINGESVNPLAVNQAASETDTIELESLDLGGLVFEDERQLPFAVFTTEEEYYRAYIAENESEAGTVTGTDAILERRNGPRGEWVEITRSEPTEASYLAEAIAEETEMETTSCRASDIDDLIEGEEELFEASRSPRDDEIRTRMAIQSNTAFPPTTPTPRRVDFPS